MVALALLNGWEPYLQRGSPLSGCRQKQCIPMGFFGVGKSALLCLLVFYLVFKHKLNVLVYRKLLYEKQSYCLLYLGYDNDKVVHFSIPNCPVDTACAIYESLANKLPTKLQDEAKEELLQKYGEETKLLTREESISLIYRVRKQQQEGDIFRQIESELFLQLFIKQLHFFVYYFLS